MLARAVTLRDQRPTWRRLLQLAAPIMGLNVLSVFTLAVDLAMCGRLDNADQVLAALSFATQVVFLAMVAMMGLTVGAVALVSRAYGARDPARVNHVLIQATQLTVLVGIGVAIAGNIIARPMLEALGAKGEAVDEGVRYLRPLLSGTVFYYLTILYGGVLRGVGNTRLPFMAALLANAVNIGLNYLLILGNLGAPRLGVQGAAIASVASYALNFVVIVAMLRRGAIDDLTVPIALRRIDGALTRTLYRIGGPAALDMLMINIAFLSMISMVGHMDELAAAAHGIGLRVQALAFVPGLGVSQATGAMVGNALGAGTPDEARAVLRASVVLCAVIMTTLGFAIISAAGPIVQLFDVVPGTPVADYAIEWMRMLGYCMPFVGVHIAFVGMLQGAGATNTSLGINFFGTVVFQVPVAAALGYGLGWGPVGVWASFPLSFVLKASMGFGAYKRGAWAHTGRDM